MRTINLDLYFDANRYVFRHPDDEEALKYALINEKDTIENRIGLIYNGELIPDVSSYIELSTKYLSDIVKEGKNLECIHRNLIEFLDRTTDEFVSEYKEIIELLWDINCFLEEYCRCIENNEDEGILNDPERIKEFENHLNRLLEKLKKLLENSSEIGKSEIDIGEVWKIYNDLKNREIKSIKLGSYNFRTNTVTLYLKAICKSKRAKLYGSDNVLMATYAHELFHAYHYHMMRQQGIRWNTSRNYTKKIVAESFASFFEYLFIKHELKCRDFADGFVDEWKDNDISYWPYSGAIGMYTDSDSDIKEFKDICYSLEGRLFCFAFSDSLDDWDKAYQDICVFKRLSNNQNGLFLDKI